MAKINVLDLLYSEEKSALDFQFEQLQCPNFYNFISEDDIMKCYNIARSNKYAGNVKLKKKMIEDILKPRGFVRIFSGTNRLIFRYLEDDSFVLKVGFDSSGLKDSLREMSNQYFLQPFVQKVFQVHPSGAVATCEKVVPIRSIYEFAGVAEDVYELVTKRIIGKYVLDDIGCKEFFQNYGIRQGFGVVLLDFPYMYELDGKKLYCNVKDKETGTCCHGVIDYDLTFDNIICTKCGKRYFAKDLKTGIKNNTIYIKGEKSMSKVYIYKGNELISVNGGYETEAIERSYKPKTIMPTKEELDDGFALPSQEEIIDDFTTPKNRKEQNIDDFINHRESISIPYQNNFSSQDINNKAKELIDWSDNYIAESTFIPKPKENKEEDIDLVTVAEEFKNIAKDEETKEILKNDDYIIPKGNNPEEFEIPKNLGEIMSSNSLDEIDELDDFLIEKFNISDKDFEEPSEEDIIEDIERGPMEQLTFEKIIKKNNIVDEKKGDELY